MIEPYKAWHDAIDWGLFRNLFIYILGFQFIISHALIGYLSIYVHITCIVHDLGALRVA